MLGDLVDKKAHAQELRLLEYYSAVEYMMKYGINKTTIKFFLSLNSFGMTKKEVYNLALALRDSGRVLKLNHTIFEKHSTGGIGDSSSLVIIPLLASLGYKIVKTTAKSFMFTNGSADRFGAIPGFTCQLTNKEIQRVLDKTNACVLSHDGDMCPADKILSDLREMCGVETDINLLAASIASKKLASGAKVVLVDVKYGDASVVKDYKSALHLAKLLKYVFNQAKVKSTIVITNTMQTIGEGVGNAVEAVDAIQVLQGKKCLLRDVSVKYAVEMISKVNKRSKKDLFEMAYMALDNGSAYNTFLKLIEEQGGDRKVIEEAKLLCPYNSVNFVADKEGYVGAINSLLLGELIRRLCKVSHDNNIGAVMRVKIGDFVKKGDIIVSFYYKKQADFEKYREAIKGCVRITEQKIKPINVIRKVIR